MMKRLALALLLLALVIPSAEARRKKESAGTLNGNAFQDPQYGYQLTVPGGWKVRLGKKENNVRAVLIQENYGVPPRYAEVPDYTYIPRLVIYADTSTLGAGAFVDSLVKQNFQSPQKKEMLKDFEVLTQKDILTKNRRFLTIAGETVAYWEGSVKYTKDVAKTSDGSVISREQGGYGSAIIVAKKGHTLLAFHVMAESEYFEDVQKQTMALVNSLQWVKASGDED